MYIVYDKDSLAAHNWLLENVACKNVICRIEEGAMVRNMAKTSARVGGGDDKDKEIV